MESNPSLSLLFFRGGRKIAEAGPFEGTFETKKDQKAVYFAQVPLEKIPTGRYTLQSVVIDRSENRVAFARTPMAIVRPISRPNASQTGE